MHINKVLCTVEISHQWHIKTNALGEPLRHLLKFAYPAQDIATLIVSAKSMSLFYQPLAPHKVNKNCLPEKSKWHWNE